jgi:hypothetical protein
MNRLRSATAFIDFLRDSPHQLAETLDLLTPCDASVDCADDRHF